MSTFEDSYLKPSEIATRLALHRSQVYKLIKDGTLPHIRIGRAVRVPAPAFEAYLRSLQADASDRPHGDRRSAGMRAQIESRLAEFRSQTGREPAAYIDAWKSGAIPDTAENAELAMDALALRTALDGERVAA